MLEAPSAAEEPLVGPVIVIFWPLLSVTSNAVSRAVKISELVANFSRVPENPPVKVTVEAVLPSN